jgi:RNA polymerase II subunit A C-terminal domain phosphatase
LVAKLCGFISTPRLKRKRLRSTTPSDRDAVPSSSKIDEGLQSPLAKRKKLAAERTGYSRLKEGITADELLATKDETASNGSRQPSPKIIAQENMDDQEGEGDDEDEEEEESEEEDDFLARELEEEWG